MHGSFKNGRRGVFRIGKRWTAAIAAAAGVSACSPAMLANSLASKEGFDVERAISYGEGERRTLDVYRPEKADSAPVIVFFYGGSWQGGAKESYLFVASALARRGYITIVPDYRVYPEVRYPAFIQDGAQAVRWAKDNARRFGGDPGKVFIMGHSAGAYIAAMLTIDDEWLKAVNLTPKRDIAGLIGLAGPYDFLPIQDPTVKKIFGDPAPVATQPITYVSGDEPPSFLATGTDDDTVDPGNASRLGKRLRAAGRVVTLKEYKGVGHITLLGAYSGVLRFVAPVVKDIDDFIAQVAGAPKLAESRR